MNSEREKADILFNHGLPLQFCCHLIQFYTVFESSHCYFKPLNSYSAQIIFDITI